MPVCQGGAGCGGSGIAALLMPNQVVMVGFRPTIHDFFLSAEEAVAKEVVDARDKHGHDDRVKREFPS